MGPKLLSSALLAMLCIGNTAEPIKPTSRTYLSFFRSDTLDVSVDPVSMQTSGEDEHKVSRATFRFDINTPVVTPKFTIKYTLDDILISCDLRAVVVKSSDVFGVDNKLVTTLHDNELLFQEFGNENFVGAVVDGVCGKTDEKGLRT